MSEVHAGHKRGRGRPPGVQNDFRVLQQRVRAHAIYRESLCKAPISAIASQMEEEGFGTITLDTLHRWKSVDKWDKNELTTACIAQAGEEMRRAIRIRTPDAMVRVEQASMALSSVAESIGAHVLRQMKGVDVKTPADLEIMTRCMADLAKCHLFVGKSLQDLRLLQASNFADNGALNGEIIPPDKRQPDPEPLSAQERVISNFAA